MVARHFAELDIWKIANELKVAVYRLTDSGPAAADVAFRNQLRTAASSVPSNIAEGFGRYQHADFARFLRIAAGSLEEVENHLRDGVDRRHFSAQQIAPLVVLKRRAAAATVALIRYLRTTQAP